MAAIRKEISNHLPEIVSSRNDMLKLYLMRKLKTG